MDSTGFDNDIFIDAVKKRPLIWNTTFKEYHDKIKKRNAWTEVCTIIWPDFKDKSEKDQNELGAKLQKKWKGMKDSFMKSVKKKTVSGQAANNRTYVYSRQLEFLLDCGSPSATENSIDEQQDETNEEIVDTPTEEGNVASAGPSNRPDAQPLPLDGTEKGSSTKKGSNISNFSKIPASKRRLIVEENLLKFMNTPEPAPVREPVDDDKSFFESLLPLVKTLPMDTKLEFRFRVMGLLREMRASVADPIPPHAAFHPPNQQQQMQQRFSPVPSVNFNQQLSPQMPRNHEQQGYGSHQNFNQIGQQYMWDSSNSPNPPTLPTPHSNLTPPPNGNLELLK